MAECCVNRCIPACFSGVCIGLGFLSSRYACGNLDLSGRVQDLSTFFGDVIVKLLIRILELELVYGNSVFRANTNLGKCHFFLRDACVFHSLLFRLRFRDLASACGRTAQLPALIDDLTISDCDIVIVLCCRSPEIDLIYGSTLLMAHLDAVIDQITFTQTCVLKRDLFGLCFCDLLCCHSSHASCGCEHACHHNACCE